MELNEVTPMTTLPNDPKQVRLPKDLVQHWRQSVVRQASKGPRSPKGLGEDRRGPEGQPAVSSQTTTALIKKNKRAIEDLWLVFNRDRQDLAKHYLSTEKAVLTYLLGFHLPNVARAFGTLQRTEQRFPQMADFLRSLGEASLGEKPKTSERSMGEPSVRKNSLRQVQWTDYGCGTGAMAQATLYWLKKHLPHHPITVDLTDLSSHLLTAAQGLIESDPILKHINVKTRRFGLEALHLREDTDNNPSKSSKEPLYGLSFGYLWNELVRNPKAKSKVIQVLTHHLEKRHDALVLIVEPASEHHARSAMGLRDQLTQLGYHALYPCPQGSAQCPMVPKKKDWCFGEFIWDQPPECRQLDKLLGADRKFLATASYVFVSPQLWQKLSVRPSPGQKVIVGRPTVKVTGKKHPSTETFEYLLCTGKSLTKQPSQLLPGQDSKIPRNSQKIKPISPSAPEPTSATHLMRGTILAETPTINAHSKKV